MSKSVGNALTGKVAISSEATSGWRAREAALDALVEAIAVAGGEAAVAGDVREEALTRAPVGTAGGSWCVD